MSDELISVYSKWRGQRVPPGSSLDEIDELHTDLHIVNEWMMEFAIPYVEDGTLFRGHVDISGGIARLRQQISDLWSRVPMEQRPLLDQYCAYLESLEAVYRAIEADIQTG